MKILRLAAACLLLAAPLCRPAAAQTLDPTFASPQSLYTTGKVYYMGPAQADGKRVVGGFFTRVNGATNARPLIRLDAQGNLDQPFSQNTGNVRGVTQVLGLPGGQYLLVSSSGNILAAGIARAELGRLNANGTPDATFSVGTGPTFGLSSGYGSAFATQPDGKILVAGFFSAYNSVPAPGVVRLNANGSVDATFNAAGSGFSAGAYPTAIAVQPDGKILIGGQFDYFDGQPATGLVRLNANGGFDATFVSPLLNSSLVEGVVVQPDGKVLVNGLLALPLSGPTPDAALVRLLPTGGIDPNFTTSLFVNGEVSTSSSDPAVVLQPDGKIIATGYFTGAVGNRLARLNDNGTIDLTFQVGAGPGETPSSLGLQPDGSLLVGGGFGAFDAVEQPLVKLSPAGAPDPAFVARLQIPGTATALARQPDGKLLLGGDFTELNGQPVHRLVRLLPSGALDAGFSAATGVLPASVSCLELQPDGKVLAGTAQSVLRFEATGAPDATFMPLVTGPGHYVADVTDLALQADGRVLVTGALSGTANGVAFNGLLRLTSAGAIDPSFARALAHPTLGAAAAADAVLVQADGRIVVASRFRPTTPAITFRLARYEANGALDASFQSSTDYSLVNGVGSSAGQVFALVQQPDGKLLAGGSFNQVDGAARQGVARLLPTGALDPQFYDLLGH
ncbi:hypothetical protein [Hymenobacter ruricola]|uniref:Delta-60 repeat domain-containing protein n=1 Tax=Hymenobacter ruricola TaxID=2791023 RepID=A0ABS0IBJ2_9BACT|nr:hypothetical protein [Hymenobacter ruricola]MBF9224325.1 hypothetical protein [Hymenobacter ruricola]